MKHARAYAVGVSTLLALFVLSFAMPAFADDWLPVPPDDLAMKDNPKQPGADAMILYRQNVVNAKQAGTDGDSDEEYIRIKIFTEAGKKYGDVEIPFVKGNMDVHDVRGRTIKPDGSVVNFDGQVFEKTIVKESGLKFLAKTFTLPDVQPGCIIEFQYRRQGKPGYVHDDEWEVSRDLFTREAHFKMIPYTAYGGANLQYRVYRIPGGTLPQHQIDGSDTMVVMDIPGIVDEPLMPPQNTLASLVQFFYRGDNEPDSESTKEYWARMNKKWDGTLEHFVDKKSVLGQEVAKITTASDSPEVKLQKIYARVQQIRNLSMEDSKTAQEKKSEELKPNANVEDVLSHGYAYGREINMLFVGLARAAGFESSLSYVASRSSTVFTPETQDAGQLSADIVWVRAGGKEYYLDPAVKYTAFGSLPWYETNTQGIRLSTHGGDTITVPMAVSTGATIVRHADLSLKEDGSASGKIQIDFTGEDGAYRRREYLEEDDAGRKKAIEEEIKSWLPTGTSFELADITNWDQPEQPLHAEGTVSIPVFSTTTGRRVLAPTDIFFTWQVREFQSQKRVNNVYFHYPYEEIDDLKFHAPAGYTIQAMPKAQKIDAGAAAYELSAAQQTDALDVTRHLVVNGVLFSKDAYPVFRSFFNAVKINDQSAFVLQNSTSGN
jgi:hypothetical protein